jgi:hypothetical protein
MNNVAEVSDVKTKIQKSIRSFFTEEALDSNTTGASQSDCVCDPETVPEAASENLHKSNETPCMIRKIHLKSVEKASETSLNISMDLAIKNLMDGEMHHLNQRGADPDGLKNQENENTMESALTGLVNSSVIRSSGKTPVLPTRKNPNRRISVSDLVAPSTDNSEF